MAWEPDYVELSTLKSHLRIEDTDDDAELALDITSASRAVDRFANRQFGVVGAPEAREYEARWDRRRGCWKLATDDLMDATGLVVADENGDVVSVEVSRGDGGYRLQPVNAPQKLRPWVELVVPRSGWWTVEALWGWTAVPGVVSRATLLQSSRFAKRRFAAFGVAGSPEVGSELRLLAKVDPDVEVILGPVKRWWSAK